MAVTEYLNFDLSIEKSDDGYVARVLEAPAGPARTKFTLPFSDLELENLFLRVGRSRRLTRRMDTPEFEAIKSFGGRLYETVFSGPVGSSLRSSLELAAQRNAGLRVRLHLTDAPDLVDLPWEFLYNSGLNRFFALSRDTPLVRYLDLQEVIQPLAIRPPLRILAVIASPPGYPGLDVEQEWAKLQESLQDLRDRGLVVLDRLEPPTLSALQRRLRQADYHVFHFVGHGTFDASAQDGVLLMQDSTGLGRPVSGQELGTLVHDQRTLRLAVLNACEGARTSRTDPFAGTAQSLVQQGIPAVIAMQFEISDEAAITLSHEFYAAVADGYPVDAALAEARKAVFATSNQVEWGTPVLYLRAPDGRIFDVAQTPGAIPAAVIGPPMKVAPRSVPVATPDTLTPTPLSAAAATMTGAAASGKDEAAKASPRPGEGVRSAPRRQAPLWPWFVGGFVVLLVGVLVLSGTAGSLFGGRQATLVPAALGAAGNQQRNGGSDQFTASPASVAAVAATPTTAALAQAQSVALPTGRAVSPSATSQPSSSVGPTEAPTPAPTDTLAPTATKMPSPTPTMPPGATLLVPAAKAIALTRTPAPVARLAAPSPTAPAGASTAVLSAGSRTQPLASGVVMNFAGGSKWVRGDQPYGTLTRTSSLGADGRTLGKWDYNIPGTVSDHFVVFRWLPALILPEQPVELTLWVYGDGSGNFLNVWVKDQAGQVRSFSFGRILHKGVWQAMRAPMDTGAPWPQGHISGPDSLALAYPISFYALVLDTYPVAGAASYTGTIYLDQMLTGAAAPGPAPSGPPSQ